MYLSITGKYLTIAVTLTAACFGVACNWIEHSTPKSEIHTEKSDTATTASPNPTLPATASKPSAGVNGSSTSAQNEASFTTPHPPRLIGPGRADTDVGTAAWVDILPDNSNAVVVAEHETPQDIYLVFRIPGLELYYQHKRQAEGEMATELAKSYLAKPETQQKDLDSLLRDAGEMDEPFESHLVAAAYNTPRYVFWLARVEKQAADSDRISYRRLWAQIMYDMSVLEFTDGVSTDWECAIDSAITVRDIDNDGEREAKVIIRGAAQYVHFGSCIRECGAVAFLVGADGYVQAAFTREYKWTNYEASIEDSEDITTVWVLKDVNADGHDDLHVVERMKSHRYFHGDYIGDGESESASVTECVDKAEYDCLYDASTDFWKCPAKSMYRDVLLRSREETLRGKSQFSLGEKNPSTCVDKKPE